MSSCPACLLHNVHAALIEFIRRQLEGLTCAFNQVQIATASEFSQVSGTLPQLLYADIVACIT